ncbi:MAG: TlpA family protein disulfide reductase [Ardenticatenaceae bacterium]|nr:TlpA family protein disulfide reductase [Anaerolineales bacterium]MCB8923211.1 TlpA family protein disulfide reductase [Ardenticatenaceae bacterium]MCB9004844.1 TlpA family protein disulfide reductase [Ardenticatenaceae bacterium]
MSEQAVEGTPKKPFNVTSIVIWVVVIGVLGLAAFGLVRNTTARPEPGEKAPEFHMTFFDGYTWDGKTSAELADLQGKVVVLNFWASWCGPCRVEADLLEQASRNYAGQDVVFVGIAYSDVEPNSKAYLQEFDITYPNAPDLGTSISDDYDITGVPETFFIDRDGMIYDFHFGPIDAVKLNSVIERMLADGG